MVLRSSTISNPVIQTLLFADSPTREFDTKYPQTQDHSFTNNFFFIHGGRHRCRHHSLSSLSCNSSPISHPPSGPSDFNHKTKSTLQHKSFRRSQSDGNLKGLSSISSDPEEFGHLDGLRRSLQRESKSMLHSAPSLSTYTSEDGVEEEIEMREELAEVVDGGLQRSVTIGESIEAMGSDDFSFGKTGMALIEENDDEEAFSELIQDLGIEEEEEEVEPPSPPMYLATGLGIGGNGIRGGAGGDFIPASFDEGGNLEEYYKRMVGEDPSNPLFLRNYGQFLESKGDLHGAEEYYLSATLADPNDRGILSLYAKLVWELHHDKDRALDYFERAAQAAPDDSHVLAAYACFLWDNGEDMVEDFGRKDHHNQIEEGKEPVNPPLCLEEYYKKMVEGNPSDPLFLRNYAQFLHQSKGDLKGAEEYYSRAMLADPGDGEIISNYAKLVWQVHHDTGKASSYFERAVQAAPEDSHILAAYASFLWETEEDDNDEEENKGRQDYAQAPLALGAMTSVNV